MRFRHLPLLLATSLLPAGCSSAPASAPAPHAETPPASPAAAAEKLGGFWLFSIERGGQSIDHTLHIALTAGELVGSLTGPDGNAREISKITLKGDKVSWEIEGQGATQRFEGKLKSASSMEGTIKMSRGSRGGQRGGSGGSGSGQSGDDGGGATPPGEDQPSGGGGGYGGRSGGGGRGGRGGGGRGGSAPQVTWKAFKSVEPQPGATPAPAKPAGAECT
jgi:hypothetical protein